RTHDTARWSLCLHDALPILREVIRGHRLFAEHPELFGTPDATWPRPGDGFEGLTVVRELGRGTFARAYLAIDPDTGHRPVVLKRSEERRVGKEWGARGATCH